MILIAGAAPKSILLPHEYEKIIAADSGLDTAISLGVNVNETVGDMDSTKYPEEFILKCREISPTDKDLTDFEIALEKSICPYDLIGGGGGRIDHTLSILSAFVKYGGPAIWWTDTDVVFKINSEAVIKAEPGTLMSFFSLGGNVRAKSLGLKWNLDDYTLCREFVSLSNRSVSDTVTVKSDGEIYLRMDISMYNHSKVDAI